MSGAATMRIEPAREGLLIDDVELLSDTSSRLMPERWPNPTEEEFERLASEQPQVLVGWVESGTLSTGELFAAARAVGLIPTSWVVLRTLRPLLGHPSAVVREGAVYGLERHAETSSGIREVLRAVSRDDQSATVKRAARGALSLLDAP